MVCCFYPSPWLPLTLVEQLHWAAHQAWNITNSAQNAALPQPCVPASPALRGPQQVTGWHTRCITDFLWSFLSCKVPKGGNLCSLINPKSKCCSRRIWMDNYSNGQKNKEANGWINQIIPGWNKYWVMRELIIREVPGGRGIFWERWQAQIKDDSTAARGAGRDSPAEEAGCTRVGGGGERWGTPGPRRGEGRRIGGRLEPLLLSPEATIQSLDFISKAVGNHWRIFKSLLELHDVNLLAAPSRGSVYITTWASLVWAGTQYLAHWSLSIMIPPFPPLWLQNQRNPRQHLSGLSNNLYTYVQL